MSGAFGLESHWRGPGIVLVTCLLLPSLAVGQTFADWYRPTLLDSLDLGKLQGAPDPAATSPHRFGLFRMPSGFLTGPDNPGGIPQAAGTAGPEADSHPESPESNRMQMFAGPDNPYLDFFLPGDPGGIGYYRLQSQLQLFDTGSSSFTFNVEAVTPTLHPTLGYIPGPTVCSPAVAWFREWDSGVTVQMYAESDLRADPAWTVNVMPSVQYGLAVTRPVPLLKVSEEHAVHCFLEALGSSPLNSVAALDQYGMTRQLGWQLLPGIHWRRGEDCWLSGGVLLPLSSNWTGSSMLQISCSWQY